MYKRFASYRHVAVQRPKCDIWMWWSLPTANVCTRHVHCNYVDQILITTAEWISAYANVGILRNLLHVYNIIPSSLPLSRSTGDPRLWGSQEHRHEEGGHQKQDKSRREDGTSLLSAQVQMYMQCACTTLYCTSWVDPYIPTCTVVVFC